MPITVPQLLQRKSDGRPIVALTAWDYALAEVLDQTDVDVVLVGDSLGMVALGHPTTLPVTLEDMIHHARAVRRGITQALTVCDLPFLSYQESPAQALHSAGRILKETGVQAVKLEGGHPWLVETVARLVEAGIPVMGHLGLTPQSLHQLGGFRQQGQTEEAAGRIAQQALALEQAGVFALVLEHIPADLSRKVTDSLEIPTIGIGAGPHCDGQILVTYDLLGWGRRRPPFARAYADLRGQITAAVQQYSQDVRQGLFTPDSP